MAFSPSELSTPDFLHSYLAEYLDGELPRPLVPKFEEGLKTPEGQEASGKFQAMRGRLQLALQSYYLKEGELAELRALVQDPSAAATEENVKIEQLGRGVMVSMLVRRIAMAETTSVLNNHRNVTQIGTMSNGGFNSNFHRASDDGKCDDATIA